MKKLEPQKVALTLGGLAAVAHLVWSVLIGLGVAQAYLGWILGLHSLNNPFQVMPFDMTRTITLIIVAGIVGYVIGWVFATLWNMLHAK